jgi:hypothetical protein
LAQVRSIVEHDRVQILASDKSVLPVESSAAPCSHTRTEGAHAAVRRPRSEVVCGSIGPRAILRLAKRVGARVGQLLRNASSPNGRGAPRSVKDESQKADAAPVSALRELNPTERVRTPLPRAASGCNVKPNAQTAATKPAAESLDVSLLAGVLDHRTAVLRRSQAISRIYNCSARRLEVPQGRPWDRLFPAVTRTPPQEEA